MIHEYTNEATRMRKLIERLFADAPKLKADTPQAAALECSIMLKSSGQLHGALSVTPEGPLRMLCPIMDPRTKQLGGMAEHFFDYEQVADIVVIRDVKADTAPSTLIVQ